MSSPLAVRRSTRPSRPCEIPGTPRIFPAVRAAVRAPRSPPALCYGALGSDTGGSIRTPSSHCGIVGIKPTYGRVSRYGVVPLSWSLDHAGPMARSVEDCAIMLQVLAGYDPKDNASANVAVPNFQDRHEGWN